MTPENILPCQLSYHLKAQKAGRRGPQVEVHAPNGRNYETSADCRLRSVGGGCGVSCGQPKLSTVHWAGGSPRLWHCQRCHRSTARVLPPFEINGMSRSQYGLGQRTLFRPAAVAKMATVHHLLGLVASMGRSLVVHPYYRMRQPLMHVPASITQFHKALGGQLYDHPRCAFVDSSHFGGKKRFDQNLPQYLTPHLSQ